MIFCALAIFDYIKLLCYNVGKSSEEATSMYTDYSPVPNFPRNTNYKGHQVVVVEGREKASEIIDFARREELTTRDGDKIETFWIVFASEPRRVWDFTAKSLRREVWANRGQ